MDDFVIEAKEHLEVMEKELLLLEKNPQDADEDQISTIFRSIHSIKGAAGFLGTGLLLFPPFQKVQHLVCPGAVGRRYIVCWNSASPVPKITKWKKKKTGGNHNRRLHRRPQGIGGYIAATLRGHRVAHMHSAAYAAHLYPLSCKKSGHEMCTYRCGSRGRHACSGTTYLYCPRR